MEFTDDEDSELLYKGVIFHDSELCVAYRDGEYNYIEDIEIHDTIGHVSFMDGIENQHEACFLAKAYFAQPTFTGSYEERQKQWIKHHGIKVGSKVKVVRKWKIGEDGYNGSRWDYNGAKIQMQGKDCLVRSCSGGVIYINDGLDNYWSFPYFALEPVE